MNNKKWCKPLIVIFTLLMLILLTTAVTAAQPAPQDGGVESETTGTLQNRGFENGSGAYPSHWQTYQPQGEPPAAFVWDETTALSGSRSVKISAASPTIARWTQVIAVETDTMYELTGWVRTENVQGPKAKIAVYGYRPGWTELASSSHSTSGTSGWKQVQFRFITGDDDHIEVVCTLGEKDKLFVHDRTAGTLWCDALQLTKVQNLERTYLRGEHIALDVYSAVYDKIADPEYYVHNLDDIYDAMEELVGDVAPDGQLYTIRTDATMYYGGLSGNPILVPPGLVEDIPREWDWPYIISDNGGIDFGMPHELGHNFDLHPYYQQYATALPFGCTEFWANLKLVYAFDELGARNPDLMITTWNGAWGNRDFIPIAELGAWSVQNNARPWIDAGRKDYENMNVDQYVGLNYILVQQIGWEPFKAAFRAYRPMQWPTDAPDIEKVKVWANLLTQFSGVDLLPQFQQWGFPISEEPQPSFNLYVSPNRERTVAGIAYARADILNQDEGGSWSLFFDASDVGIPLTTDLHAFTFLEDGTVLLVFDKTINLPGTGKIKPWEIVRFVPSQLGPDTAGSFIRFFDGSNVGLNAGSGEENIDAIDWNNEGLFVSTAGQFKVPGWNGTISGSDEDIAEFDPDHWTDTSGSWHAWFDGSQIPGLKEEDIAAVWIENTYPRSIYISVKNEFLIAGTTGGKKDILHLFDCDGAVCADIVWRGNDHGLLSAVDGLYIGQAPSLPEESSIEVCVSNIPQDDMLVNISGDLGNFSLRNPGEPCHTVGNLAAGSYAITEHLPADWHEDIEINDCQETSGSGLSLPQISPDTMIIDLAAGSAVECRFGNIYHPGEPNDSMALAASIQYGDTVEGMIEAHDGLEWYKDRDFYHFSGRAGENIVATIHDSEGAPVLQLLDPSGNLIVEDGYWGSPAQIEYELPITGDYFLVVKPWLGEGAYSVPYYVLALEGDSLPGDTIFFSPTREGSVGGIDYARGDIITVEEDGRLSILFNAAAQGISSAANVHAFTILEDDSLLLVFDRRVALPGLNGRPSAWDVVKFTPNQQDDASAGTFSWFFDGSDVGLTTSGEKIDGLAFKNGSILISTRGGFAVAQDGTKIRGKDEDILEFAFAQQGAETTGVWDLKLDGSTIPGMAAEDISSLAVESLDEGDFSIYFNTNSRFRIAGVGGTKKDIVHLYACDGGLCAETLRPLSDFGYKKNFDALALVRAE